jgi:hypothetical protein
MSELDGTWPADDLRRAFVAGAAWHEYQSTGFTMWRSDRDVAESEAERRYPGGLPPRPEEGEEQCYAVLGAATGIQIGVCVGDGGKANVLKEEPAGTKFVKITRAEFDRYSVYLDAEAADASQPT